MPSLFVQVALNHWNPFILGKLRSAVSISVIQPALTDPEVSYSFDATSPTRIGFEDASLLCAIDTNVLYVGVTRVLNDCDGSYLLYESKHVQSTNASPG